MFLFLKEKSFYFAAAILIGNTIGVGIFGLPYVISKSGFLIGAFHILILGAIIIAVHLMYSEVIFRTKEKHRLVGYASKYLGKWGKLASSFSVFFGYSGALLAYILVGGSFLRTLVGDLLLQSPFFYSLVFFSFSAAAIFLGLKFVAKGELYMTSLLILFAFLLLVRGLFHVRLENIASIDFSQAFVPYGVVLFSLGALSAIPEVASILRKKKECIKPAIVVGTALPVVVYLLFSFVVIGVTGVTTTAQALDGLNAFFKDGFLRLGAGFGFLAVATSFLVIGLNLKESLWYDYHLPHTLAWVISMGIPLFLFLFGTQDFIKIISIVGGVSGGLEGMIVVWMYKKTRDKTKFFVRFPRWLPYSIIAVFLAGIIFEIWYQFY